MKSETLALLPPEELFTAVCQLLQEGYDAEFSVTGNSMWPLLAHGRDSVTLRAVGDRPLKKGEIVLLRTERGYLLHRITGLKNGMIQTTGDRNCYRDDYVDPQCVLGYAVGFTRKGKYVPCSCAAYRFSCWLWRVLYPIRQHLLRILFRLRRRTS